MAESELITPPTIRVAVAKPKFGIYYALLIIALCAMLVACGVLYKFIRDFGGFGTVKGKVSEVQQPASYSAAVAASAVRPANSRSRSSSAAGSSLTS
jgi:hypothetical protein